MATEAIRVYVGTYTSPGGSKGIYVYRMDLSTGALTYESVAAGVDNPSYLALHPQRRYLYAVNEIGEFNGKPTGAVSAFAIDQETGALTPLNQQASEGRGPCYVYVDATGQCVLVANYGEGSIAALPIQGDGSIGKATTAIQHEGSSVDPARQEGPHAHMITTDPGNRYVFSPDLGLDKIMIYKLDPDQCTLTPNDEPWAQIKRGEGPRHLAFHPNGRNAYIINEMGNTITAFTYDADKGALREIQMIPTLPGGYKEVSHTADIHITLSGKFLYGSNRGHDTLAIYAINDDGTLTALGYESTRGGNPRGFGIDPTGAYLLVGNMDTDTVVTFRIDQETGSLTETSITEIPKPVCLKMMPIGS